MCSTTPPAHLRLPQAAHDHRPTPVSRHRRQHPTHQDVQHHPAPASPLLTRSPSRVVMIGCGDADHVSMMSSWSAFGLYSTRPRSIPAASSTLRVPERPAGGAARLVGVGNPTVLDPGAHSSTPGAENPPSEGGVETRPRPGGCAGGRKPPPTVDDQRPTPHGPPPHDRTPPLQESAPRRSSVHSHE